MRKLLTIILLAVVLNLMATEKEDFVFIQGLFKNNHQEFTMKEIDRFLSNYPQSSYKNDVLLIKANLLIMKKSFNDAEKLLNDLYKNNPIPAVYAQVLLSLAEISRQNKEYPTALSYINDYFQKFPRHPDLQRALFLEALVQIDLQNFDKAFKDLQEASAVSFNKDIELKRIELYLKTNQKAKADSVYHYLASQQISERDISYAQLMILKYLEQNSDWDSIITAVSDSLDGSDLYNQEIIFIKVNALSEKNEYTKAMELLARVSEESEKKSFFKGKLLLKMHQSDTALPILKHLSESAKNTEIKTISYFHYINFLAQSNPDSANVLLAEYLIKNPNQKWEGDIYYQLGFNYYKQKNYNDSYLNLDKSVKFGLDPVTLEKALYLKGETQFLLSQKQNALDCFKDFISRFPDSKLKDEALFKIAVSMYNLVQKDSAAIVFSNLIKDYPNSSKIGMSNFYLAEIELNQKKLNNAKKLYETALLGNSDRGTINLRLAYIDYLRKAFQSAKEFLNNVPDENDYIYDKYLLKGNILFAEKNYTDALKAYNSAEEKSPDQLSLEHIWSRQAWTYYKLKQYDQATKIYKQLSAQSSAPGKYVLSAAGAAFNAENYNQAVELYSEYIKTYPQSQEYYKAVGGLANAYFNLANYPDAIKEWEKLVDTAYPKAIIENALQGIQWSYQYQNKPEEFLSWLDDKIKNTINNDLKKSLFEIKYKFEYEQKEYKKALSTINTYLKQFPEKKSDDKIQILLANNYIWLKQYEKADSIYINLVARNKDPEAFHAWGHIKWAIADTVGALKRFKKAADNSKQDDFWLVLLEKQTQAKDPEFDKYYKTYTSFAGPYHLELAKLILVEKNISSNLLEEGFNLAVSLDVSENPFVRAKAIFLKGLIYYQQKKFSEAQTEFLRIRYVFTEYEELRLKAEYYLCLSYLDTEEKDKAIEIFQMIKDKIGTADRDSLNKKIKGREE